MKVARTVLRRGKGRDYLKALPIPIKYATSADVLSKVNASLTKHGIASVVTPNLLSVQEVTTAKGNVERLATVEVTITLIDSEFGESFAIKGIGSGQDAGDKATAKAQTMALKYCYMAREC